MDMTCGPRKIPSHQIVQYYVWLSIYGWYEPQPLNLSRLVSFIFAILAYATKWAVEAAKPTIQTAYIIVYYSVIKDVSLLKYARIYFAAG